MMEPADLGKRHDLPAAAGLNRSPLGGILAKRKMRSGLVVIREVRNKDPSQMPFIQDDHVVQAFAPHAADQAFHIRILPRASWRRGRCQRKIDCSHMVVYVRNFMQRSSHATPGGRYLGWL